MKRIGRVGALVAGLLAGLAWFRSKSQTRRMGDSALLLDDSATPAPYGLSPLQEPPVFEEDESGRPFTALADLDARESLVSAAGKPGTIDEMRSGGRGGT
jgi:hypothetical protein